MILNPNIYVASPCVVAEGPRWNATDKTLYWVDVTGGMYLRHRDGDPADKFDRVDPGLGKIGALACTGPGKLLLFTSECRVWECVFGGKPMLKHELPDHAGRRFNDVWIDAGNAFCGVACEPGKPGELWLLRDGRFTCIEKATAGMPNGMGVSPDGKTLYFVVTDEKRVWAYDYDRSTGALSNKRVLCEDFAEPGLPDGMTVDPADGTLWIGMWDGGRLEHRGADGKLLGTVPFPMKKVTSVEVVGDRLFVTTGNKEPDAEAYFAATKAGSVFEVRK